MFSRFMFDGLGGFEVWRVIIHTENERIRPLKRDKMLKGNESSSSPINFGEFIVCHLPSFWGAIFGSVPNVLDRLAR